MSVILAVLIIFGLPVLSIKLWKNSKILSLGLTVPFFLVLSFIGYVIYNSWYHTTPDSLKVTVQKENNLYSLSGAWVKPLDGYRFVTDYIVIFVPYNTEVSNVIRNRYKNINEMDEELETAARNSIKDEIPSDLQPYIIDIEATKEFRVSFELRENVNPKDIKAYYVHIREEPMSSLEFWFKKIRIK